MRTPGDILLLSTYELGHAPHLLAAPLGFLAEAGFSARVQDLSLDPLDEEAVGRARLVGIAVPMHTALRIGARVAERVRALNPAAHICFYGLYAPLHRDHLVGEGLADSVLGGELEAELVELARALERGQVPGPREVVLERLRFPVPRREALPPPSSYARLISSKGEQLAGYVEASRGCLHRCRHCPIPAVYEGRFFVVPEEVVVEDARRQVQAGARHLSFGDPDFLNGPGHALRVARALHRELPELSFDVTVKVEHILRHRELFPELRALGCAFLVSAVESLSDRVLEILDKGHTRADVDTALEVLDAAGIPLRPTFVAFTPFTSLDDYLDVIDWLEERDLVGHVDPIQLAIRLLVPPGSKLLELEEVRAAMGPLDPARLTYAWRHPDPRMDPLAAAAHRSVEEGAASGESPRATFARIKALALEARGSAPPRPPVRPPPAALGRPPPPRLTEAWFC